MNRKINQSSFNFIKFCVHFLLNRIQQQQRLLVATEDGVLYVYNIDPNEGGDLTLYKQYSLEDGPGKEESIADGSRSSPRNIEGGEHIHSLFLH